MKEDFYFFNKGCLNQCFNSNFYIDDVKYSSTEQYMMAHKASFFNDKEICEQIMKTENPKIQKELGRKVKNFDSERWDNVCRIIVYDANYAKFTQNDDLKNKLLETGDKIIVYANPNDSIWGIGLSEDDEKAWDSKNWNGKNYLGKILTEIRKRIMKDEHIIEIEDYKEATGVLLEIYEAYDEEEEILSADGFDDAIIGIDENSMRIIYSVTKCINILMKRNNLDIIDATEYFEFNVKDGYVGEKTPIWCEDRFIGLM